jgi:hypothetical protein
MLGFHSISEQPISTLADASGSGAMTGTATITFAQTGDLKGAGALTATAATIVFGQTGGLKGAGALTSTAATIVFGQTGDLKGAGALTATAATIVFGQTGDLKGAGVLTSVAGTIVFGQTGTLDQPSGGMDGTATMVFGQTGTMTGAGALTATAATITFGQSGTLVPPVVLDEFKSGGWVGNYDFLEGPGRKRKKLPDKQKEEDKPLEIVKTGKSSPLILPNIVLPKATRFSSTPSILQAIDATKFKSAREKRAFIRQLQLSDDEWLMMN